MTTVGATTLATRPRHRHRLTVGQRAPQLTAMSLAGATVAIPDPEALVHLQFRRFAGCPVCNLHLRGFAARVDELRAAGIREVAVFHSDAATMRPSQGDLPFDVIADPGRALYRQFGVEAGWRSILDPRAWGAMVRGMFGRASPFRGEGGHLGLPADFLIAPDGVIVAARYGRHAADHWSLDELLALAAAHRSAP